MHRDGSTKIRFGKEAIGRMQGNASESGRTSNDHQIPRLRRNGLFACIYIQQMLFLLTKAISTYSNCLPKHMATTWTICSNVS